MVPNIIDLSAANIKYKRDSNKYIDNPYAQDSYVSYQRFYTNNLLFL